MYVSIQTTYFSLNAVLVFPNRKNNVPNNAITIREKKITNPKFKDVTTSIIMINPIETNIEILK